LRRRDSKRGDFIHQIVEKECCGKRRRLRA
jgi:hypothetical protein